MAGTPHHMVLGVLTCVNIGIALTFFCRRTTHSLQPSSWREFSVQAVLFMSILIVAFTNLLALYGRKGIYVHLVLVLSWPAVGRVAAGLLWTLAVGLFARAPITSMLRWSLLGAIGFLLVVIAEERLASDASASWRWQVVLPVGVLCGNVSLRGAHEQLIGSEFVAVKDLAMFIAALQLLTISAQGFLGLRPNLKGADNLSMDRIATIQTFLDSFWVCGLGHLMLKRHVKSMADRGRAVFTVRRPVLPRPLDPEGGEYAGLVAPRPVLYSTVA
eukprot:TRINITY_DN55011_c0_g1_i1.p1 TRINITY_DN55011_c0_g1~~TRINITY_DN55011_c0_g1_i1.p1  ORF type:complete len:318 (+),score=26.27 TRINITY_DN55011_c0_g1_i1:137-955(+)